MKSISSSQINYRTGVIFLTFLAFLLRIYLLANQPLRGDESFTIQFSARPLEVVFPEIAAVEPNPPLYYLLFHYWIAAIGDSEFATRFFSLFFGVWCMPLIWRLGRIMGGEKVGFIAASLIGINPFQIWHSQDVRLYTLWPAITLLGLIFFLLLITREQRNFWLGFFLAMLAGLYTHYFHAFVLLAVNIFFFGILAKERIAHRRSSLRALMPKWLGVHLILVLLYLPWLIVTNRPASYFPSGETPQIWQVVPRLLSTFTLGETVPSEAAASLGIILFPFFIAAIYLVFKEEPRNLVFLLLYILVPALAVYALAQWRPFFRERYLNAIAPGFYLLFAYGLALAQKRWPRQGTVVMVSGLLAFTLGSAYSLNNYWHDPVHAKSPAWPRLATFLKERVKPGDIIIFNYPDPSLDYYYDGAAPLVIIPSGQLTPERRMETVEILWEIVNRFQRIWLLPLPSPGWDEEGLVERWLDLHGQLMRQQSPFGFRLLRYRPVLVTEKEIEQRLGFRLGDSIRLMGYDFSPPASTQPGETISFTLYWQALAPIAADYHVFTHLIDDAGHIWAQKDNAPRASNYPTYLWAVGELVGDDYQLASGPQIPAGEYKLVVGMYLLQSGERLPVLNEGGEKVGNEIEIGKIEIK